MKLEHIAFNVKDPVAVAAWYVEYLGFEIVVHKPAPHQTHFLGDGAGSVIEIYCNPTDQVPDYASQNPLIFHLAVVSEDPAEDAERLIAAGAQWVEEVIPEEGSHLIMLRDPWGLALQLCKRARSLV
jgi:catechol 2,3-dioxygenase-like lactoylglutathione lyase family enzyme